MGAEWLKHLLSNPKFMDSNPYEIVDLQRERTAIPLAWECWLWGKKIGEKRLRKAMFL